MDDYITVDMEETELVDYNCSHSWNNSATAFSSIFNKCEKAALIVAYSFVFCCCVFGNLLVMVVVFLHRRLRTTTNFFLTNLAVADFCVGVFCVFQNLSLYLMSSWPFGNILCKMYHFIQSLSYTASVVILMVICVERYVAIIYPLWSKHAFTLNRLRVIISVVWLVSAIYCCPRLIMYGTAELPSGSGTSVECFMQRRFYDSETYDIVSFVFLLLVPLIIIILLYAVIGVHLWKGKLNSDELEKIKGVELGHLRSVLSRRHAVLRESSSSLLCCHGCESGSPGHVHGTHFVMRKNGGICICREIRSSVIDIPTLNVTDHCCYCNVGRNRRTADKNACSDKLKPSTKKRSNHSVSFQEHCLSQAPRTIIKARRKVVRLLLAVVLCFAVCNLPFHARKLWQYWSPQFNGASKGSVYFTIGTTLLLYFNSGINPILYAFLSENFRNSMKEVVCCRKHPISSRFASHHSTARVPQPSQSGFQREPSQSV